MCYLACFVCYNLFSQSKSASLFRVFGVHTGRKEDGAMLVVILLSEIPTALGNLVKLHLQQGYDKN